MAGGFKVEGSIKTAICKPSDGVKEMSTTRFWGEPDDGVKVRHAEGGPLFEISVKIWGELGGNRWPEGSKLRGLQKLQYVSQVMVWKKMSTTRFWGEPDDGVEVRHAEGGQHYGICLKIWG